MIFARSTRLAALSWLLHLVAPLLLQAEWSPPTPSFDSSYDWIKLTSGEWLKGEIRVLYEEELEFDSEILDTLFIDWDDIAEIHSARDLDLNIGQRQVVTGRVEMKGERAVVRQGEQETTVEREEIVSIAPDRTTEWGLWDVNMSAGANYRSGNTDEVSYHLKVDARRATELNRLVLSYLGQYSESQGIETANSHDASVYYDLFLSRRVFLRLAEFNYYRDPFQNIRNRYTLNSGIGYKFIDRAKIELDGFVGPGGQIVQFSSVVPGSGRSNTSVALAFGFHYNQDITSWIEFDSQYRASWLEKASGSYLHQFENSLSIDIYDPIELDLTFLWEHTANPTRREDGTVPDQNDFQLLIGLGVEF